MKVWLVLSAASAGEKTGSLTAAELEALQAAEDMIFEAVPPLKAPGPVYTGSSSADRLTAQWLFSDIPLLEEPLLSPVSIRAFSGTARSLPLWLWRAGAALQRRFDTGRQPESRAQIAARTESLAERLEKAGEDCVLVCDRALAPFVLDSFRRRGYCAARSGFIRYMPLERILLTRRNIHCGGCSHNCLLSNPGCSVGRDKAARNSQ